MMYLGRVVCAALMLICLANARETMSLEELRGFLKTAKELKLSDREVADYVLQYKFTGKLDDAAFQLLQEEGAGPVTLRVLKGIQAAAERAESAPSPSTTKTEAADPAAPEKPLPEQPLTEEQKALQQVTDYAQSFSANLPDFICAQRTRRYVDPTGSAEHWQLTDTLLEKLTYFGHKEDYKLISINDQLVTTPIDRKKLGGATSSGEFGSVLSQIFAPQTLTNFTWERWGTLRGRRMHVFRFRVEQSNSGYSIEHHGSGRSVISGYHGLVYVDRETTKVMRIRLECDTIPPDFPIQNVSLQLDYDFIEISGQKFLLPLRAELQSREGSLLSKNEVEFRLYRKFSAEATITFDK